MRMPAGDSVEGVSIILPVYNEEATLYRAVIETIEFMRDKNYIFEIIIAEDGSTDSTPEIADKLSKDFDNITYLHSSRRLGRGISLKKAIYTSRYEYILYYDSDLSTELYHISEVIRYLDEGYDIVVGSRLLGNSVVKRSFKREFFSRGYNLLVRLLLGSRIHDHQCGFKGFRKESILLLLDDIKDNHWFWDTEILVRAQKKGLKLIEIPIKWREDTDTKVRLKDDIIYMGKSIIQLFVGLHFKNKK